MEEHNTRGEDDEELEVAKILSWGMRWCACCGGLMVFTHSCFFYITATTTTTGAGSVAMAA